MSSSIPVQPETKEFGRFLARNPAIRNQIHAAPDRTLLYSGAFFRASYQEIKARKLSDPQLREKEILPDVLARISIPPSLFPDPKRVFPNLLAYVNDLELRVPKTPDQFTIWKVLSGIFAANAVGKVSFWIGGGVDASKVFVATELKVLMRNPKVDQVSKDLMEYYLRCVENKNPDMNIGFISA